MRLLFAALALLVPVSPLSAAPVGSEWESSLVYLEVTRKAYEVFQPWTPKVRTVQKNGLVISPREILTTAEELSDRTLIRVQKGGRGKWWNAEVTWIDYHANLAVLTSPDATLWAGLKPAAFVTGKPPKEGLQIVRWRNGNLETRKAEFNQFIVEDARLSFIQHLQLEASTEMQGVGWAEPLVAGGKVAGLATGQGGNNARFLPASFIEPIFTARKAGKYPGLGYFPFTWTPVENPSTFKFLKLPGDPRGALVVDVPKTPALEPNLKPRDLIISVDGFDVDNQGYYKDPDYGQLIVENLGSRRKFAGDVVKMKVWRDGAQVSVDYKLPKLDYSVKLLAEQTFDQAPEYFIAGGLVFQPLNIPLLRGFGDDWKRRAPFRLVHFAGEAPSAERSGLVALTSVLPDPYVVGYQDARLLLVDTINGKKISRVADVQAALQQSPDGFHTIEFLRGDNLRRIVLDAAQMEAATKRILERYRIPAASNVAAK
ncbi:MAG: PDZ domain-containing protein [Limisphaerales bacterium]